jgi:hypothetical protein
MGHVYMAETDPDDELELDVDLPIEADLEDEPGDPANEPEPSDADPENPLPVAATGKDQVSQGEDRKPSRGEQRIQTLRNELKERDTRLAETNRRIDALLAAQAPARQQGETPEQRAQRFGLMTPQEQIAESLRESELRTEQRIAAMQFQSLEMADRTQFQAKYASKPEFFARWAPKVEGLVAEQLAKGRPVEREVALRHLIGEAAIAKMLSKEGKLETRQAQRRVQAQRTRPVDTGSDTQAQRRTGSSVERRLENMQI